MDKLISWARCNHEVRHTHRPLSSDELNALAKDELMDIGSHTVTHPYLSAMSRSIQRYEVRQSKLLLEDILGRSITSFSYPYGNYTADVVALVRDAEYDCACAVRNPPITKHHNVFQLPRIPVEDWDGAEFATRLTSWQTSLDAGRIA
jgi:peptidoglycan/xylan/chitin deacetylase (PgdA/CDA1 family)